jgi:spore germination protein GerM
VYFVHGGPGVNGSRGRLETVSRFGAESPRNAVLSLLRGINPSERARGLRTAIPQKTRLVNFSVARDTASIWLRTQGAGSGPPAEPTWKRLGGDDFYGTPQLAYTLTVFRTIKRVALFVNGPPLLHLDLCVEIFKEKGLR